MVAYALNVGLNRTLLGFNLKNEKFTKLLLPPDTFGTVSAYLTVVEGCLGIYKLLQNGDIVVWRMRAEN